MSTPLVIVEAATQVEQLVWHKPATRLPDDSIDVLIFIREGTDVRWDRGYLDGGQWIDSDGMPLGENVVTAWADPQGPA